MPDCMSNDGNAAIFVGTFLHNGDAVALCEQCMPSFTMAVTASMTGVDLEAIAALIESQSAQAPDDPTDAAAQMAAPPMSAEPPTRGGGPPAPAPADPDHVSTADQDEGSPKAGRTPRRSSGQPTDTAAGPGE